VYYSMLYAIQTKCISIYIEREKVRACARARARASEEARVREQFARAIYAMRVCVCVCEWVWVWECECVSVWERERERERESLYVCHQREDFSARMQKCRNVLFHTTSTCPSHTFACPHQAHANFGGICVQFIIHRSWFDSTHTMYQIHRIHTYNVWGG